MRRQIPFVLLISTVLLAMVSTATGEIIYVDADAAGNNNGSSWADAFNYPQDALAAAQSGDEIWVALGTYTPDSNTMNPGGTGSRDATFELKDGVAVRGGYAGYGEPAPNARDIELYETILSGDLAGNDIQVDPCDLLDEPTRAENSYHVVTDIVGGTMTILDGFTITGGNADDPGSWEGKCGGGMYNLGGSPTVTNCRFTANSAGELGGGMCSSSAKVRNCTFSGNLAGTFGGGIRCRGGTITNCMFVGNGAGGNGGGIESGSDSSTTVINCVFSGNTAGGGGAWSSIDNESELINCTFSGNTANTGGVIYSNSDFSLVLTNCIFWGNSDSSGTGGYAQIQGLGTDYSCIQGWSGALGGVGNIGGDPLFVDADGVDNIPGTEDDNLRLLPNSPCLDAGDNTAVPASVVVDIDGNPRFADDPNTPDTGNGTPPIVDMGAHEGHEQGFLLSSRSVAILEGTSAQFTVALAMNPIGTVEVIVAVQSGDADIVVESGGTLTFDSSNYLQPQSVMLAAVEDIDNINGVAVICVSAPGFVTAAVTASEIDNDQPTSNILFVDAGAPGINTGSSWAEAYTDLQDAMSTAAAFPQINEICIAKGIYKPDRGTGITHGDREAAFQLVNDVVIKGGYAGFGEPNPNARDIDTYKTILSGDLNDDDVGAVDDPSRGENSYHVVTASGTDETCVVDGVTITGGNADGEYYLKDDRGGGIYSENGSPTLNDCTFIRNSADDYGSAIYNKDGNPVLTYCTFNGNLTYDSGGIMYNYDSNNPTLTNCTFTENWGGGMRNYNSSPTLTYCSFIDNSSSGGGGMDNWDSSPMLTNCTFSGNFGHYGGGGMYNYSSSPTLNNCTFSNNTADRFFGGGMVNFYCNPKLANCTFSGNSAPYGGGMGNIGSSPNVVNCTFIENLAVHDGGGMFNNRNSNPELTNCILWSNTAPNGSAIYNFDSSLPVVSYSDVQGAWPGNGNIDADPLFVDADGPDDIAGTEDDNLRLMPGSPCINSGTNDTDPPLPPTDLDGNPRILGGTVDMGAYEFNTAGVMYVDMDAPVGGDGRSWETAVNYLQVALATVGSGDEILVAEGTYTPDSNTANPTGTGDRKATFKLKSGVVVKGGYAGYGEPDPNARDIELYETILSGDLAGNDVQVDDPCDLEDEPTRAENSYHVVTGSYTDKTAVLDGFTITAGNANGSFSGARGGGGMFNQSGSPAVTDCTFRGNYGSAGGGMNTRGSSPTVTNCTFRDNRATSGGGMSSSGSQTVRGCKFIGNSATDGGGINVFVGEPLFEKCIIRGNSASEDGGGIQFFTDNWAKVIDCQINGNTAGRNGGGMYCSGCYEEDMIINCTISGNTAGNLGGGMYTTSDSSMNLFNCIFWGDTPDEIYVEPTNWPPTVYYCCIQGDWPGTGNINVDPHFFNAGNDDLRLLPDSPCIDAGDNTAVPAGVTTDLDGNPRFVDQPEVPDTGNGTAPIVDMGAFEADYIKFSMKFTPQALNISSSGQLVKAHFVLPEGFSVEDVDANTPCVIAQFGVESYSLSVLLNDEGLVRVEATFRRSDLCGSITSYDQNTEVMVIGRLTTGQYFYGTDIIKITDRAFEHLALFVSYWLQGDCIEPDWCGGADLNADSVVNFLDFALLDRCCIEVINQ